MRYLLDTNVVSDARRGSSVELNAWLEERPIADVAISSITLLELEVGILRVERRDPAAGRSLRGWLDRTVIPLFRDRLLPVDELVAHTAARLHVPDPMPDMDALIAATALVHGLTLATRNTRDMRRTSVPLVDPWAG